jgi:hypothetical protein
VYDAGNPNGLSYDYIIVDPNGYKLAFRVLYNPDETLSETLLETLRPSSYLYSLPADMTNMIKYTGTKLDTSHVYSRHGLDYRYSTLGTLYDISWAEKNKLYIIDGCGSIGNYPMDGQKTIIHCLLSLDEPSSATAFTELKDAINKKS